MNTAPATPEPAADTVDVAGLLAFIARHGLNSGGVTDEPADGSLILRDEELAFVRTDEAADQAAGTWWKLDGGVEQRRQLASRFLGAFETAQAAGATRGEAIAIATDRGHIEHDTPWSLGEILGMDETPEDRVPHRIEQLFTVEDLARIVEVYAQTVHDAQQHDAAAGRL